MRKGILIVVLLLAGCNGAKSTTATTTTSATTSATTTSTTKDVVRFVALGDTGRGNDGARRVARAIANKCATDGCDFALLLGDNVYQGGAASPDDPALVNKFENVFEPVDV